MKHSRWTNALLSTWMVAMMGLGFGGCAADAAGEDDSEDLGEEEDPGKSVDALSGRLTGKCPANHVCLYQHRNYNNYAPKTGWAWKFGPEEWPAAIGRKFQRKLTAGKDKVSSVVNNTTATICLVNETYGGFRRTDILKVGPKKRYPYVGKAANDRADYVEEC